DREPPAQREHDRVRDEVGREDPRALVLPRGQAARYVRQGHVRNARVEHLHERRERHRERYEPGTPRRLRVHRTVTVGTTDMPTPRLQLGSSGSSKTILTGTRWTTFT